MTPADPSPALEATPETTVVVVPRERFSAALRSLDSILERTEAPHRLLYVDGNSPPAVREGLERRAREHGFRLLRSERYLAPNRARNLALEHVTTPYVAYVDNDVVVERGWLTALLGCASATGAALVGPLTYEGEPEERIIHVAGGVCELEGESPNRLLLAVQHHLGRSRDDVDELLVRCVTGLTEFHCVLVRREVLERTGPLDEGLLASREHLDLSLAVRELGEEIWFEPEAVVTYCAPERLESTDRPFFLLRWSEGWIEASLDRFSSKHGITPGYKQRRHIATFRRSLIFTSAVAAVERVLGARAGRVAMATLSRCERAVNRLFVRADGGGELHVVR